MVINRIKPGYLTGAFVLLLFIILTFFNWPLIDHVDRFLFKTGSGLIRGNKTLKNEDLVVVRIDIKDTDTLDSTEESFEQACLRLTEILSEEGARVIVFTPLPAPANTLTGSASIENLTSLYPQQMDDIPGPLYRGIHGKGFQDEISTPVYTGYRGSTALNLALEMVILYHGEKPVQVKTDGSGVVIEDIVIPLINGRIYTPYRSEPAGYSAISHEQLTGDSGKRPDIKGRVFLIEAVPAGTISPKASLKETAAVSDRFLDMINNRTAVRPAYLVYIEILFFAALVFVYIRVASSKGHFTRAVSAAAIILFMMLAVFLFFIVAGVWVKTGNMILGTALLSFLLSLTYVPSAPVKIRSYETSRIVGLNLQSQGELDKAFEEFKTLPLDNEAKELIYNLGLEYEKRNMPAKAVELYTYINKGRGFRDLDDRIPMLKASDYTSTMGSYRGKHESSSVLSDSKVNARTMVGRYKIIGQIGKGSMGLVYKAQDPKINRLVAIKTIRFSDEFEEDVIKEIKERFFMEAEIAGKLSHQAIVTIHDVGDDGDLTYMAMEFLEGEDLDKFIKRENLLPVRTVLDIVAQIAGALDYAHKDGVIHRDIKPANVM
ncbi:MAG: serine/threonine protein kinase, partial [Deltaproteobacteria bacterium]|nr:serine/threonine protein kinase [Deltaproteobacteria bacterium]